ncbi:MAG TPA: GNAT family N-acetyltransferase [Burkholderiales bacterium]
MTALQFRRADVRDTADIVALVNSAYRGDSSRAGWTTEADLLDGQRTDAAEIAELIGRPQSLMLLCLEEDRLIGCVHLERIADDTAYFGMFTVEPTLQGRGIGKRFLREAERTTRAMWGVRKLRMTVISRRHELIAFYERRGFRRTGEREPFPRDIRFGIPKVEDLEFEVLEKDLERNGH